MMGTPAHYMASQWIIEIYEDVKYTSVTGKV